MIISIASGKGGTGKTTVAVNLAVAVSGQTAVRLLDCDVEEPNCHIFLNPEIENSRAVGIPVPVVNRDLCTACGQCAEVCQFKAIAAMKSTPLVFAELCHGCGGCALVCPEKAITEVDREVGVVESGRAGRVQFYQGRLNVGEAMAPPVIRAVKKVIANDGLTIIDSPPGTSCPMIATIRDSDFVVLVTEPTPFGLHDLVLAVETVKQVRIPCGVVINRADVGDARVADYCQKEGIPILLQIPDDRRIAEAYSRGRIIVEAIPEFESVFGGLYSVITQILSSRTSHVKGESLHAHL